MQGSCMGRCAPKNPAPGGTRLVHAAPNPPSPLQLFFSTMSLIMVGVKYKGDKRAQYLHHGSPLIKLGLWAIFTALPFLFPNPIVNAYGVCKHPHALWCHVPAGCVCSLW